MRHGRFIVGDRPQVDVSVGAGDILLLEGAPGEVSVDLVGSDTAVDTVEVVQSGDVVTVRDRSGGRGWLKKAVDVTVTVPPGTRASLRAASGSAVASVTLSDVSAQFASGDLRLDEVSGHLDVESASGDVALASIGGELSINTASGDIRVGAAGERVAINSASGDVNLGRVSGSLKLRTASGDVNVRSFAGSELTGKSMSGDFRVGLEPGMAIEADIQTLSGSIRNEITESGSAPHRHVALQIKTLSGDILLHPAS